jgi:PilZ domain
VLQNPLASIRWKLANSVLDSYMGKLVWLRPGHAMGASMERRATERFPLNLPLTVRWTTQSGIAEVHTESQDVSSGGIYFLLSKQIKDGSPVEIVMTLPHEIPLDGRNHVLCRGRVRRTEVIQLNRVGVAVQIEHNEFLGKTKRNVVCPWPRPDHGRFPNPRPSNTDVPQRSPL